MLFFLCFEIWFLNHFFYFLFDSYQVTAHFMLSFIESRETRNKIYTDSKEQSAKLKFISDSWQELQLTKLGETATLHYCRYAQFIYRLKYQINYLYALEPNTFKTHLYYKIASVNTKVKQYIWLAAVQVIIVQGIN